MPSVRPFRLLGESQLATLREQAGRAAAAWQAEWLGGAGLQLTLGPAVEPEGAGPWLALRSADAACFIERRAGMLESALFGAAAGEQPSAVAREVAEAALADLGGRLLPSQPDTPPDLQAPAAQAWQAASGAVLLTLRCVSGSGSACELVLLLDGALTARWLAGRPRPPRTVTPPLQGLRHAIGQAPVRVGASIGEAELDVATLQSLVPGDVLLLDLPVDRPLRLTIAGRPVPRGAYLGSHQGRRALQLAAASESPALLPQSPP